MRESLKLRLLMYGTAAVLVSDLLVFEQLWRRLRVAELSELDEEPLEVEAE